LLQFNKNRCFSIIAKVLDALLEVVLGEDDTLQYYVGLILAATEFVWSRNGW
jgi:hypothetical protein